MYGNKIKLRKYGLLLVLKVSFGILLVPQLAYGADQDSYKELLKTASNLRFEHPDSSLSLLNQSCTQALAEKDTLRAIEALFMIAKINWNIARQDIAYDKLWEALMLADMADIQVWKSILYGDIGRRYGYYKRRDQAIEYLQKSLDIKKDLVKRGKIDASSMSFNYYHICSTLREHYEYELASKYLDSCYLYLDTQVRSQLEISLKFEEANILSGEGQFEEGIGIYEEIIPWYQKKNPSYLVLVYTYLGDAFMGLKEYNKSELAYKSALEISSKYKVHLDFSLLIHEKLAALYVKRKQFEQAFNNLELAKDLNYEFFDSRSTSNKSLLDIQDAFRKQKEVQLKLIQQQKLEKLEHEEAVWFLQKVILLGSVLFLVVLAYLFFKYVRSKHRAEKELIKAQKEQSLKKSREILEVKNKELAAYALKMIEKDENMILFKEQIMAASKNGSVEIRNLNKVFRSISVGNKHNWKEFEARFIAVNQDFYRVLSEKYPSLSPTDLKVCALIKLNFSSKEMAKLLGISVESVHTSRHRLRKKMGLTREVNLTEFIWNLEGKE